MKICLFSDLLSYQPPEDWILWWRWLFPAISQHEKSCAGNKKTATGGRAYRKVYTRIKELFGWEQWQQEPWHLNGKVPAVFQKQLIEGKCLLWIGFISFVFRFTEKQTWLVWWFPIYSIIFLLGHIKNYSRTFWRLTIFGLQKSKWILNASGEIKRTLALFLLSISSSTFLQLRSGSLKMWLLGRASVLYSYM